jgi:hypothetical protein
MDADGADAVQGCGFAECAGGFDRGRGRRERSGGKGRKIMQ